ncbi:nuclear autoantigen Sp-100-like [Eleginops maclovinus]
MFAFTSKRRMEQRRARSRTDSEEDEDKEHLDTRSSLRKKKRLNYYIDNGEDKREEEHPEDDEQPCTSKHNKRSQQNGVLTVSCGNKKGTLHVEKHNSTEACIESEGRWFYPREFEIFGGKTSSKKWRHSIQHENKPLQCLIDEGHLSNKSFKRRAMRAVTLKKIVSSDCTSESSTEESEIESAIETDEDDDDDWGLLYAKDLSMVAEEGESNEENEEEVVDTSKEEEGEIQEREQFNNRTPMETPLKEVKVVLRRFPEVTTDCLSIRLHRQREDFFYEPLEEETNGEERAHAIDPSQTAKDDEEELRERFTQSNESKQDGHRKLRSETSAAKIRPKNLDETIDTGTTSVHTAIFSTPLSGVTQRTENTTAHIQKGTQRELDDNITPSGHDAAQVMEIEARDPQTSSSTSVSTSWDPETTDLEQLKREKIKMQLKVLKLQEEYYTLKIREHKK